MNNTPKNLLNAAVEMANNANEQLKKNVSELMKMGNLTEIEGKALLSSLEEKLAEGQKEYESFLKKTYSNISKTFSDKGKIEPSLTKPLEDRVVSLELKISLMAREMMEQKKLIEQLLIAQQSDKE